MKKIYVLFLVILYATNVSNAQSKAYGIIHFKDLKYSESKDYINLGFYNSDSIYIKADYKKLGNSLVYLTDFQKINFNLTSSTDSQWFNINYFEKSNLVDLIEALNSLKISNFYTRNSFNSVKVKTNFETIKLLTNLNFIKAIRLENSKIQEINFLERTGHRTNPYNQRFPYLDSNQLTGKGIIIGEWDGGAIGNHIDYNDRVTIIKAPSISNHATHVAGTMSGAGNLIPNEMGMAPESRVFSWDFNGDIPLEMDTNKSKYNYVLTQNSYGYWGNNCSTFANYDGTSTEMDILSIKHKDLLHVFAAANSRAMNCFSGGYGTIVSGFQSAKNTISVAAITFNDGEANFSSAGPTKDGRLKPEISAIGVNVLSTLHNNAYGYSSGTSMATPGATGTIALMYEKFIKKHGYTPLNFLAKNLISNSADDIGNSGPDFKHGFGKINAIEAVRLIDSGFWHIDSVIENQFYLDTINLPANLHELKVLITWNDPEVSSSNNQNILVNDLDLSVNFNNTNILPWVCNHSNPSALATRKRDSLNNIEQVTILNPDSGQYILKVFGKKIPVGKQIFSISYIKTEKSLKVVYPNGFENMESPSNAAKSQLIRWNAKGVTGTFTIQFSRDSGQNWSTLANNIANNINSYTWQNASDTIETSKALIKVFSSSNIEDQSDYTFNICKPVTGIISTSCSKQVYIRWNKQFNTKQYKIFQLKNGRMETIGLTKDTSFLVQNLDNKITPWFSISRIHNNGAESPRINAFSVAIDSTRKPPEIIIQPKGMSVCFNQLYFAKSTVKGTNPIANKWEYTFDNNNWTLISNSNDSINLKNHVIGNSFYVRRTYTNSCLAPVYSDIAYFEIDSVAKIKFKNLDSMVCKNSILSDSAIIISQSKPLITWFKDSLTFSDTISTGFENKTTFIADFPYSIWLSVKNQCGIVNSKNNSTNFNLDGKNTYSLFPKPEIEIKDTLISCIGENFSIQPILKGGKTNNQILHIQTKDSNYIAKQITLKIESPQWIMLKYFDNCYPDTIFKSVFINTFQPLNLKSNKDTTVCYFNSAKFYAKASGGNGNYTFTWNDIGVSSSTRTVNQLTQTQKWILELTDNCTEKTAKDSFTVTVLPELQLSLSVNNDTLCYGNLLKINSNVSGGRNSTINIEWSDLNLTGFNPNKTVFQSETFIAKLSDGCSPEKMDTLDLFVREKTKVEISILDTVCHGKNIILSAKGFGGDANYYEFEWIGLNKFGSSINFTPLNSQEIILKLKDDCTIPDAFDTLYLNVFDQLELLKINDTSTCYGKNLTLINHFKGGKTNTQKTYWNQVVQKELKADSFNTQTYQYSVSDACQDSISKQVLVTVGEKLDIQPQYIKKCENDDLPVTFVVNSNRNLNLTWNQSLSNGKNQVFTNKTPTFYRVTIDDFCSDTSQHLIKIDVSDFSDNGFQLSKIVNKMVEIKLSPSIWSSSIQWDQQNKNLSNDSIDRHIYNNYGIYEICRILEDEIGCQDTICKTIENNDPTNFKQFNFKIFPNPIQDVLNISFNQLCKTINIEIYDAIGRKVLNFDDTYPATSDFTLDIEHFKSGVYILKININGELFKTNVIKL